MILVFRLSAAAHEVFGTREESRNHDFLSFVSDKVYISVNSTWGPKPNAGTTRGPEHSPEEGTSSG